MRSVATTQVVSQPLAPKPNEQPIQQADGMVSLERYETELRTSGANVLLCGQAGRGKSHVMKAHVRSVLYDLHGENAVWVTPTTGMAALGVEGCNCIAWQVSSRERCCRADSGCHADKCCRVAPLAVCESNSD